MPDDGVSVLISTYRGDDPENLDAAIASVVNQTHEPDEVVLVEDGPLTNESTAIVRKWLDARPDIFERHALETNRGLGEALQFGVEQCSNDLVARMDADDLSVLTRLETQLAFLAENPEVDVVGGYVVEFEGDPESPHAVREVPTDHDNIARHARTRSPMNHVTTMFRREAVLSAGNYRPTDPLEDYDLWVRLLLDGATFANVPEVLVKVRAGPEMYRRRGGWRYARRELAIQAQFLRWGFIGIDTFLTNSVVRLGVRILPNAVRGQLYSKFLRK